MNYNYYQVSLVSQVLYGDIIKFIEKSIAMILYRDNIIWSWQWLWTENLPGNNNPLYIQPPEHQPKKHKYKNT